MPGGVAGLQNQSGGRKAPGGFDSLPSPPLLTWRNAQARYDSANPAESDQLRLIPGHHVGNDDFFRRNQRARTVVPAHIDQLSALAFEFIDDGSFGCRADRAVDVENFTRCAAANSFKADIYHNRAPLNSFQQVKTGFSFEEKTLNMLGCPNQHSCRKKMAYMSIAPASTRGARFRP